MIKLTMTVNLMGITTVTQRTHLACLIDDDGLEANLALFHCLCKPMNARASELRGSVSRREVRGEMCEVQGATSKF